VKALNKKTPQPSTALSRSIQEAQGQDSQPYIGTRNRLKILRRDCLIRDRYRCVISRHFDFYEAEKRENSGNPVDDDGKSLLGDSLSTLEVAHIIPHSLTKPNEDFELVRVFFCC
jgi:hypothetical protein